VAAPRRDAGGDVSTVNHAWIGNLKPEELEDMMTKLIAALRQPDLSDMDVKNCQSMLELLITEKMTRLGARPPE
jgi:hypothetical protein